MKFKHLAVLVSVVVLSACTSTAVDRRLRALEDERDILHTMYTYAHALDYNREDEFRDLWTEDATLFWAEGPPGRQGIMAAFHKHPHAPVTYWKHLLVEPRIQVDGDRATAVSYFARLFNSPNGPVVGSFGRYRDVFVRGADGKWRFKERRGDRESCIPQCSGFGPEYWPPAGSGAATGYPDRH